MVNKRQYLNKLIFYYKKIVSITVSKQTQNRFSFL